MTDEDELLDNDEITPEEQAFMEGYEDKDEENDEFELAEDEDETEEQDEFMQRSRTEESIMEENFSEE